MKARVKSTGEIVDETAMVSAFGDDFYLRELEPISDDTEVVDYWTRLEHIYAGMAMQGICSSDIIMDKINTINAEGDKFGVLIAELSANLAHALIQKLKEKEEEK